MVVKIKYEHHTIIAQPSFRQFLLQSSQCRTPNSPLSSLTLFSLALQSSVEPVSLSTMVTLHHGDSPPWRCMHSTPSKPINLQRYLQAVKVIAVNRVRRARLAQVTLEASQRIRKAYHAFSTPCMHSMPSKPINL